MVMSPKKILEWLRRIELSILTNGHRDPRTKATIRTNFNYIYRLIKYQIPNKPINISDDGHKFECPRCHTKFDSEDHVDDYYICYICGQRWKEEEKGE